MIDCKTYAKYEKNRLKTELSKENEPKRTLCIFQVGDNPASNAYIKGKIKDCEEVGIVTELYKYDEENVTTETLLHDYRMYVRDWEHTGAIFQLPMPVHINVEKIIDELDKGKDVDGFKKDSCFLPCTPKGIIGWLEYNGYRLEGRNVCIIGRSDIVGKPLAAMMIDKNATVTLCHSKTRNLVEHMQMADVIVVAVGKRNFIHDVDLPKKPIIIDVGINRDENGHLCGDVNYENMKDTCSYITPVPGGVGLLTRVALLSNVANLG